MYYRNTKTGNAFPSYETLRELTGMRKEMISKALKELENEKQDWVWLKRKKRFSKATIYTLLIPLAGHQPSHPFDDDIPF